MKDTIPWLIDSCPRDGPTMSSCTIRAGAGILPDFNTFAKSFVTSGVKLPVICELPPVISEFTRGALYTYPSNTMAISLPMFFLVKAAQRREPSVFIDMLTQGLLNWSYSSFASVTTSPSSGARPLRSVDLIAYNSKIRPVLSISEAFTPHISFKSRGITSFTAFMFRIRFTSAVSL